MEQLQIDFTHPRENNFESEQRLFSNRKHFNGKCRELLIRLCNGERIKFADEVKTIGDTRRRSLDLIESGIPVQREFLNGDKVKTYYIKQEDLEWVKKKYFDVLK